MCSQDAFFAVRLALWGTSGVCRNTVATARRRPPRNATWGIFLRNYPVGILPGLLGQSIPPKSGYCSITRVGVELCNRSARPCLLKDPSRILFGFYSPKLCRVTGIRREAAAPYTDSMALSFGSRAAVGTNSMLDRLAGQLERYMDLLSARQKLVASNIANADTPGYHRSEEHTSELQSPMYLA